ncbi:MAG: aminotransferase class I/II-fold pyridoxal phosphate-dependent enzyme [Clostridiales bacterium]|nr:aminotransferase class I/II-fold pyridoxal phosphate-dependent enzyme [Clostridiales bacterium]
MPASISEFIKNYDASHIYPFHMPGHKRRDEYLPASLLRADITEIAGADNLRRPAGIIRALQERLARLYQTDESFLLVNGASCGLIAAVLAVCGDGDTIIAARNCHQSVYYGLILSGARPVYLYPELTDFGFAGGVSPAQTALALREHPEAKAVVITSPTYEGLCSDVKEIARIVHEQGGILIVDEAHGAHFGFYSCFPRSAAVLGADIVVQSLHKTLPVMTQAAVLHISRQGRADTRRVAQMLAVTQTSSPSYMLMASVENCAALLEQRADELFGEYAENLCGFREEFINNTDSRYIKLLGEDIIGQWGIYAMDPGKLAFVLNTEDIAGLEDILAEQGVAVEMSGERHILAMTSIADTKAGFDKLLSVLLKLSKGLKNFQYEDTIYFNAQTDQICSPRRAFFGAGREMVLWDAEGYVSRDFVIAYPPGIPLIAPGERISGAVLCEARRLKDHGKIIGIDGDKISILEHILTHENIF